LEKKLPTVVSVELKLLGYRKGTGTNWFKDFREVVHVVGLYKSRWGHEYYLGAGVWLKAFGPEERPRFLDCHLRLRLDVACGVDVGELRTALSDRDKWKMDTVERGRIISAALRTTEAVFFDKVQTQDEAAAYLSKREKPVVLVKREARELLGLK
jgi:hypothetical protein